MAAHGERRPLRFVLVRIAAPAVAVAILVGLYMTREHPVLFELEEPGDPLGPVITIFHPLRDRSPERAASQFLQALKRGDYEVAFAQTQLSQTEVAAIGRQENDHRLDGWSLDGREDTGSLVKLAFATTRGSTKTSHAWVTLARGVEADEWQVIDYEAWY